MADLNRALASADHADAFVSLLCAAHAGCLRAQTLVGWAYQTGRGVAVDYHQASDWYRKAAGRGDSCAIANLGLMSLLGQGAPPDDIEAYVWLQSAVGLGHTGLQPVLAWLERRIGGAAGTPSPAPPVSAPIPSARPCNRPVCDPSRCEAV